MPRSPDSSRMQNDTDTMYITFREASAPPAGTSSTSNEAADKEAQLFL